MFSPELQSLSAPLVEYLWRILRLPRRAIRFLLYLYSPQKLEATLRYHPKKVLSELPDHWKNEVPVDPPPYPQPPPQDHFLTPVDSEYSAMLHDLYDPPWVLYARGDVSLLNYPGPRIAVVGTRRASHYARRITAQLVAGCKPYRPLILSGMAWGIDGVAHQSALDAGMATLAVLGAPLDAGYSPSRQKLFHHIEGSGLLLTELYPGATMASWRFPERNRLLAALAQAIVVVEAPIPSGALLTAQEGLELGREIFVVPGGLIPHCNAGGHRLIQEGAHLLTHPREIFQVLGYEAAEPLPGQIAEGLCGRKNSEVTPGPGREMEKLVDDLDGQILKILQGGPLHVDKIIAISQRPAPAVLARLIEMSLGGSLSEAPGAYFEINK